MAKKEEITPLRSIRLPNERGEDGRAAGGSRTVITDAAEMSREHLKRLAEKGDVLGMEPEPVEAEPRRSAKKDK